MSENENIKTLLVIGNGFDIAHGLKTKYTDFLNCVRECQEFLQSRQNEFVGRLANNHAYSINLDCYIPYEKPKIIEAEKKNFLNDYQQKLNQRRKDENYLKKWRRKIQSSLKSKRLLKAYIMEYIYLFGNAWINYFQAIQNEKIRLIGENWVDFENEIANIIQKFEKFILNWEDLTKEEREHPDRDMAYFLSNYRNSTPKILIQKDIPNMAWDLKMLTLALEFYLIEATSKEIDKPVDIIKHLSNVSAIISYNYSNIFGRIYKAKSDINLYFIHGELGKHNLILGIGETLDENKQNKFTVCASFKKFFQRIKYKLGNNYKNVLPTKPDSSNKWQIVIYGHSLDVTDEDSLKWLFKKAKDFKITIYYIDDNAYNQQISNAIQIIGKDQLIKDVNAGRIVFLPVNS